MRAALQSTLDDDTCALVVAGEAGIGKTRLLGRLVAIADEADVPVLVGCCWELDRSSPLAPVAGLLGDSSVLGEAAEPEAQAAPDPRPDGDVHLQRQKRRLFAGLVDELRLAAAQLVELADGNPLFIEELVRSVGPIAPSRRCQRTVVGSSQVSLLLLDSLRDGRIVSERRHIDIGVIT
jgi:predicted ATPase